MPQRQNATFSATSYFFLFFFAPYSTPPSILNHVTWVSQSRLAFGHQRRVGWPQAFGPLPITILTHHSFACRWRLQLPAAIKNLFRLKPTLYA